MIIEKFNAEKHYSNIKELYNKYNLEGIPLEFLSDFGLVISNSNNIICAGWLYTTNSSVCYIENFIANKDLDKNTRKEGLQSLFRELIKNAKENKFKLILTNSKHNNLIQLGIDEFNFIELDGYKVFYREL